jgi:hypothetical protein
MIVINPPVAKPYAPSTQPIAFVGVFVQSRSDPNGNQVRLTVALFDVNKRAIGFDRTQVKPPTATDMAAFAAAPGQAGDTHEQSISRRALSYVSAAYGLNGTVE